MHEQLYLFLMNYVENGFYFKPRLTNHYCRLEKGFWFIGNEKYIQTSFWIESDTKSYISEIGIGFRFNGELVIPYADLCCRGDDSKEAAFSEIADTLRYVRKIKRNGVPWNYWEMQFAIHWKSAFSDYIDNYIPVITDVINRHGMHQERVDRQQFNAYIDNINRYR